MTTLYIDFMIRNLKRQVRRPSPQGVGLPEAHVGDGDRREAPRLGACG